MYPIDYSKISNAIDFYVKKGFQYIETPWIVRDSDYYATCKKSTRPVDVKQDTPVEIGVDNISQTCLVGSAEQGFYRIRKRLQSGTRYVSAGPCFRLEKEYGYNLQPWFFKTELIWVGPFDNYQIPSLLRSLLTSTYEYFELYAAPKVIVTELGFDIEIAGLEVGSYGYRECRGFQWIYGTGCAEPRLSQAIYHYKNLLATGGSYSNAQKSLVWVMKERTGLQFNKCREYLVSSDWSLKDAIQAAYNDTPQAMKSIYLKVVPIPVNSMGGAIGFLWAILDLNEMVALFRNKSDALVAVNALNGGEDTVTGGVYG